MSDNPRSVIKEYKYVPKSVVNARGNLENGGTADGI